MAKRMTDTNKWRKVFFKELPWKYKLLWFYMLDDCDHAGIWHVEMDIAQIRTNTDITEEKALELFADKIIVFDEGEKWFIPDFIEFQYGKLKPGNRAHDSVIFLLNKYNLLKEIKGHLCPSEQGKEQEKVKGKEQEKERGGTGGRSGIPMTQKEILAYYEKHGKYPKQRS